MGKEKAPKNNNIIYVYINEEGLVSREKEILLR